MDFSKQGWWTLFVVNLSQLRKIRLAQWIERVTSNHEAAGSTPASDAYSVSFCCDVARTPLPVFVDFCSMDWVGRSVSAAYST